MILNVKDLSVALTKQGQILLRPICFSIDSGESLMLLGESGSGKTMTCYAIMNLLIPNVFGVQGDVVFQGESLLYMNGKRKREIYGSQIAFIPQNPMTAMNPSVRIGKQMLWKLCIHRSRGKTDAIQMCKSALKKAGLYDPEAVMRSYPYMLSGGMLQRVFIALAIASRAELIVTDEPTTALDALHKNVTVDAFIELRNQGAAILLVTHDFSVASRFGGNLMILKEGELLEKGLIHQVLIKPTHSYTKALIDAASYERKTRGIEDA